MSILSELEDGFGFFYGFVGGDHRQINVRKEAAGWVYHVHGDMIGVADGKASAEARAVEFVKKTGDTDVA